MHFTLHSFSMSETAFLPTLAATMMSSCLSDLPAATALLVAKVMGLVALTSSSGSALPLGISEDESKERISWAMA